MPNGTRREWGVSVTPRPVFTPGKTRYPLYRRLSGPQVRSGQVRKISPPQGFDPQNVQPIASHYTDWATWPTMPYEVCVFFSCISSATQYMHCFAQRRPQNPLINNSNCGLHSLASRREGSRKPTIDTACVMKPTSVPPTLPFPHDFSECGDSKEPASTHNVA
jgi:hypothetical protein